MHFLTIFISEAGFASLLEESLAGVFMSFLFVEDGLAVDALSERKALFAGGEEDGLAVDDLSEREALFAGGDLPFGLAF